MATSLELEEENFSYAMQLASSSALSMSLKCAIDLGVFDIIAKAGPGAKLSPTEIAAKLPITSNLCWPTTLCSAACSVIEENGSDFHRLYGLLPVSKFFVSNKDGVSLCPLMSLNQDNVFLASWVYGMHSFEYTGVDSRFNQVFNTAMYNMTSIVIKKMLQVYKGFDEPNIKRLVDTLNLITETYPHIKAINFDLSNVLQHAPYYPGVEHVGGDMFASVPRGDAIFMKWILHDWSDEKCIKLLKNCYKAIPENGKVVVMEAVVPIMPATTSAAKSIGQGNAFMMTQHLGGKERSKQEFLSLAFSAGFSGIRFQCCVYNFWVMESFK